MEKQRSRKYDEITEKLAMGRIDIDEEAIPFVIEEALKRKDADVIAAATTARRGKQRRDYTRPTTDGVNE